MTVSPTPPKPPQYMTYVASRRKVWATHNGLGQVKTALGSFVDPKPGAKAPEMFAYELEDGEYVLMWHIEPGTLVEDLPWEKKVYQPRTFPRHSSCHCPDCI